MPCQSCGEPAAPKGYTYQSDSDMKNLRADVDLLSQMLCLVCRDYDKDGKEIPDAIKTWWNAHEEADRKRLEEENAKAVKKLALDEAKRKREEIKQTALSKLSWQERAALGLNETL